MFIPESYRGLALASFTMLVLFAITLTAKTLVEERKKGILERLLTTRLSVGQLFVGKFLANVSRGFVQTLILLVLAYMVFQLFTPLSFIESLVIALIFAAAASALRLVIATFPWLVWAFIVSILMIQKRETVAPTPVRQG